MDILNLFKDNVESVGIANADSDKINLGVDFSFFTKDEAAKLDTGVSSSNLPVEKKKRTKAAKTVEVADISSPMANPVPGAIVAETDYAKSYEESINLLRGAIIQIDVLTSEMKDVIDDVRESKTLKNKHTYLTNYNATESSLIGTKIQAIRELTNIKTQIHNLELNRFKTLKIDEKDSNDDMRMMDIYSAFVNAPVGSYAPPVPNIQDINIGVNAVNPGVSAVEMVSAGGMTQNALTPEENRMRLESNPNIQVVVRYNQSTGQRAFDVIDKSTGMSVPNYPRPDNFLLDDTTIDIHMGIARNRNINSVWPLIIEGSNSMPINEY